MANQWHAFEPTQFFPAPIQGAVTTLNSAFTSLASATKVVEKALQVLEGLAATASTNPVEAALRTLVGQIDEYLQGVLGGTQVHAIIIPIKKRKNVRTGHELEHYADFFSSTADPAYAFVQGTQSATTSTRLFWRTLSESVRDPGDSAKPDFPSTYAVAGACVLAGAETLSELQVPFQLFENLFASNQRISPSASTLPVVKNLKITTAALNGGTGVVLRWDPLSPVMNVPRFTSDTIVAKEIFVVRVSGPFTRGFFTWKDLFTIEPTDDPNDLQVKENARVVARIRNTGLVTGYTDSTNLLDPKETYYFTTCVRYTIAGEVQPMGEFSNCVRALRTQPAPSSRMATPPDWMATPTLVEMFPPLNAVINQVRLGISRLDSRTTSNTGVQQLISQTVTQIGQLVAQWEATVAQTTAVTEKLQLLTAAGTPSGLYSTVIVSPEGGIDAWMVELARRLNDSSDASRPEFSADSVVTGFVVVAGAPRLPDLSALIALLRLFFGNHPKSPLADVVRQMDGTPAPERTAAAPTAPRRGFDPAMNPSKRPTC